MSITDIDDPWLNWVGDDADMDMFEFDPPEDEDEDEGVDCD
jgi:hypothetical protein